MFALFKAGAVPVLVDPGIDRRALRQCLGEAQAEAFIGIPLAMLARRLLGWAKSARVRVTTGARPWLADTTLAQVERRSEEHTSELQSLMRISYAVFCLKKKKNPKTKKTDTHII